jgi:hypothetical protein
MAIIKTIISAKSMAKSIAKISINNNGESEMKMKINQWHQR